MLNNAIIYENRKLFTYNIDLTYNMNNQDFQKETFYKYIDFNIVNYPDVDNIFSQRILN